MTKEQKPQESVSIPAFSPYTSNSLLLAMDSATSSMTTALVQGNRLLGETVSRAERNHSLYLVPSIEALLSKAGLQPDKLNALAVGVGPGSYTGVRIGVTVAKTMAWTHRLTLLAVSSLEALALGGAAGTIDEQAVDAVPSYEIEPVMYSEDKPLCSVERLARKYTGQNVWIVPVVDARRGQAFTGLFQCRSTGQAWSRIAPDGIRLMSRWLEQLTELAAETGEKPDRLLFTGELELHVKAIEQFAERWPGKAVEIVPHQMQARYVAELALERWKRGNTEPVHSLVPNYTQLAEAETKLLASQRGQG